MHISHTGVLDAAAYTPAEKASPERSTFWIALAVLVPAATLYALIALLTALAMLASGAGVTWTPLG